MAWYTSSGTTSQQISTCRLYWLTFQKTFRAEEPVYGTEKNWCIKAERAISVRMSFSRTIRPWIPTLLFLLLVLALLLAVNYNSGSQYVIGDEEKPLGILGFLKNRIKPLARPNSHWRDALPWDVDPKRFLPNFFTYLRIMTDEDRLIYRRSNIAYVHVPRSGGITMNTCLNGVVQKANDFDKRVQLINEKSLYSAELDLAGRGEVTKLIISGEFAFGACDFLQGRPCSYVLLMRDPYDRIISSYAFCKKHNDERDDFYCSLSTEGLSIVDWAILEGSPLFRQLIAHPSNCGEKFENHFDFDAMIDAPRRILKTGKYPCWMKLKAFIGHQLTEEQRLNLTQYVANNLEYWFAAVGTLEEKDVLLQSMQDMFYLPVHNVCSELHKADNTDISEEQREIYLKELQADPRVAEAIKEDLILYERVKEVSILQAQNHFDYFHRKLDHRAGDQ